MFFKNKKLKYYKYTITYTNNTKIEGSCTLENIVDAKDLFLRDRFLVTDNETRRILL